jgi:hypothetical protein
MYKPHSIVAKARPLAWLTGLTLAALTLTPVIGASPAQASVSDPVLSANLGTTTVYNTEWWAGGGSCMASGSARWDRAQNLLVLNGSAQSSAPFAGCWARLRVTYWYGVGAPLVSYTTDIPTACSTADQCPSTRRLNTSIPGAINGGLTRYIDHITISAERR